MHSPTLPLVLNRAIDASGATLGSVTHGPGCRHHEVPELFQLEELRSSHTWSLFCLSGCALFHDTILKPLRDKRKHIWCRSHEACCRLTPTLCPCQQWRRLHGPSEKSLSTVSTRST